MKEKDVKQFAARIQDLQRLLDSFGEIERMIYKPDGKKQDQRENDVEHSFTLAITAWFIASSERPELDVNKVVRYALVHDFVEIYAGDVMAIGRTDDEQKQKELREAEAVKMLQKEWTDFPDLTHAIEDYEAKKDPESIFVKSIDKLMPMLINMRSDGKTWKKYNILRDVVVKNKDEKTKPDPTASALWQAYREEVMSRDEWFNEGKL